MILNKSSARISRTGECSKMACESCPKIFSREKCLHAKCSEHKVELAAFKRKVDEHIHEMVVQAWHPRTKALEVQTPEIEKSNVVSRKQSPKHHHHSAQTSGNSHSPGKNEAAGDVRPPRNHKTFSAPAAHPNERIASDLLPMRPPICAPLAQPGQSTRS